MFMLEDVMYIENRADIASAELTTDNGYKYIKSYDVKPKILNQEIHERRR